MSYILVFIIFSLSFLALFWGIKDSPRAKLLSLYVKKRELAEKSRLAGDDEEYRRLHREAQDAYDMIRILDKPFSNSNDRRW